MTTILHVTDAAFAGTLYAITDIAREQAKEPDTHVMFAYAPRPESPGIEAIREIAGPQVRVLRLTSAPRLASAALLTSLGSLLRREKPDILHLHSSRAGMIGRFIALLSGAHHRTVYSPHGLSSERTVSTPAMRAVYTRLERLGARMAPALALCSWSEQQLVLEKIPEARTAVLANSVDVDRLRGIARAHGPKGPRAVPEIVHVGRITEQKLAAAFGRIAESWHLASDQPVRFRWIGDGDRSLLPASVEATGWMEREELLRVLAGADLMLFTSASEGMPMALLEAQALGVPVVASRVTGVVDVIEDEVTGLLRDTEDELRTAAAALIADPSRRRELGAAASARIATNFDMSSLAKRSFAAYAELGISVPVLEGIS
ncbi:glycosyltransferase [Brachybacterium sp.]|uniref:glycosyltransferase n=1 Tax=Brachybacterium sp. TaxID=1891286 RepID=UPI002ED19907